MRFLLLTIWAVLLSLPAHAGAWAREKGDMFIAAGGNFWLSDGSQLPVHYDPTLYAEYGLTDRVTIGLDLHTADKGQIISGFVFANVPLGPTDGRNKWAGNLAYGYRTDATRPDEVLLRGGLSWGRGLEDGWLAVDASVTFGTADASWRPKLDATWGHNWDDRWTTTFQLQTGQGFTNDYYAKVSPTIVWTMREDIRLSLGYVQALTGDRGAGLKLETWLSF